jgi:hypothetical protein
MGISVFIISRAEGAQFTSCLFSSRLAMRLRFARGQASRGIVAQSRRADCVQSAYWVIFGKQKWVIFLECQGPGWT